jgi:hypothetical protein
MVKQAMVGALVAAAFVCGTSTLRGTRGVVGVVTAVGSNSLEISRGEQRTQAIALDAGTSYMKWITHQPWQQSTASSTNALNIGRCVSVELRSDSDATAKVVRISRDEGTVWDPCKSIR